MGLDLLARLLDLLRKALLEEGGSDWALLSLGFGRRGGGRLGHRWGS